MPIQAGSFKPLPPKEKMLKIIENEKARKSDVTAFMPFIQAVAERFGDKAYNIAAKSLTESGLKISTSQLKKIAKDLRIGKRHPKCPWVT